MSDNTQAVLLLEDGTRFEGRSCGSKGTCFGEICFNTAAIGYPEVISDPSYGGQIIVMTYPQIGNYGIACADLQSDELALRGLVVRDMCQTPSNFRSEMSLPELLVQKSIVAIDGIDTRQLVTHVRDNGTMKAVISTEDFDTTSLLAKLNVSPSLSELDVVEQVSTEREYEFSYDEGVFGDLIEPGLTKSRTLAVYDCGCKRALLRGLTRAGFSVTVVPWDTPADKILAKGLDAVLVSNGPGSPGRVHATVEAISQLVGKLPLFGIGLGHQLLALAAGGSVEKLKVGHHGGNYPVVNPLDGTVEITLQSHQYSVLFESLGTLLPEMSGGVQEHPESLRFWIERGIAPVVLNKVFGRIQLTHIQLNDNTVEGLKYLDHNSLSLQFHPALNTGLIQSDTAYDIIAHMLCDTSHNSAAHSTTHTPNMVKGR